MRMDEWNANPEDVDQNDNNDVMLIMNGSPKESVQRATDCPVSSGFPSSDWVQLLLPQLKEDFVACACA